MKSIKLKIKFDYIEVDQLKALYKKNPEAEVLGKLLSRIAKSAQGMMDIASDVYDIASLPPAKTDP